MARKAGLPKKRNRVYYANESHRGVRLRDCLHTDNFEQANENLREIRKQIDEGKRGVLSSANREWLKYSLAVALDALHADHAQDGKREGGLRIMQERAKPIKRLLGDKLLRKITNDDLLQYRANRQKEGVGERTIGMEFELLRLVLKKARRWERVSEGVKVAKSKSKIGRALSAIEVKRLFSIARTNPRWYRALYAAIVAINTTARKCEILNARFQDVDLAAGMWRVSKSKTDAGEREIPLNPEVRTAFTRMFEQAAEILREEPQPAHFIFCRCENNDFDYTKPQKSVRSAWRALTKKAGLVGLRLHDLRHCAITNLAEAGVPPEVMKSIVGHVSQKMLEHYIHIRTKAKVQAVAALGGTGILESDSADAPQTVN